MQWRTRYNQSNQTKRIPGAQKTYRTAVEACERARTDKRIETLVKKAKMSPNEIWQARKRSQSRNELEYNTITEEDETLTDPEKTKEYIADYFEELYQARPGTPEYEAWTKHITDTMREFDNNRKRGKTPNMREQGDEDITTKEINTAIKKLRRRKSIGPDEIPNKVFIEADPTTRELLRQAINQVHQEETIPNSWLQGNITRLYKGKGTKGKCSNERGITLASNAGKLYERIINERVKNVTEITEAQAGGIPRSATADHLIALKQTIRELRKKGKTAYVIFLDVQKAYDKTWLDAILYAMHKNGVTGKNLHMIRKLNSNLTARIHTRFGTTREIKIRDSIR